MAARGTGLRIAGVLLATLCLSTAMLAQQVVFALSTIGCPENVCINPPSVASLSAFRSNPYVTGFDGSIGWGLLPALDKNENGLANRDESGNEHSNKASAVYTGVAFGLLVSLLKSSENEQGRDSDDHGNAFNAAPVVFSTPAAAHLEFVQTSSVVATPEPTTEALLATGLFALGFGVVRRRRRNSLA